MEVSYPASKETTEWLDEEKLDAWEGKDSILTIQDYALRTVDGWFAEGKISEEKAKRLKEIIATQKEEVDYSVEEVFDIALKNNYTKIFM